MSDPLSRSHQQLFEAIRSSPEFFFKEVLGDEPEPDQVAIANDVRDFRRTAVKSGHSCGKDWDAARIGLWFHVAHYPSIVVVTGPTDRQVKKVAWGEVATAYKKAKIPIGGRLLTQELQSGDPAHYMIGYTATTSEAFQGFHSDNVLVIVTEASGIKPEIWKGVDALMTARKNAKLLAVGNALYEPGSEFASMFMDKAAIYKTHTLDSRKSKYCSREWIEEMRTLYGEGSPVWLARVEGIFSTDMSDTLIPLGWIDRAFEKWRAEEGAPIAPDAIRTLGIDVARFGSDETVYTLGVAGRYRIVAVKQGQDLMQTVGLAVSLAKEHRVPWRNVRIDDTGVGGGVTDRLKEQDYDVTPINFGAGAHDDDRYANVRSEIHMAAREEFRAGTIALDPSDRKLLRDLSTIKYKMTSKGQIQMEPKADMKKRLGNSPDRSDSLVLALISQGLASEISSGRESNDGLLGFMRAQSKAIREKGSADQVPANKKPVASIPGAAEVLEKGRDHDAQKTVDQWHSTFGA